MSYTGPNPVTQSFVAGTDYFTGNGVTLGPFILSRRVGSTDDLLISINNEEYDPTQYTLVSGNQLSFPVAPPAPIAPQVTNNIVVRYMTTVLWQSAGGGSGSGGVSNYYELLDVSSSYAYALLTQTVTAVTSATQLTVSSVTGLAVGNVISATVLAFTGQVISDITGSVVTVTSTTQWGPVGTPTTAALYLWNTPVNNTVPVYSTTTQKWQNSIGQLVYTNSNVGIGVNVLANSPTLSINNIALGNNALSALKTILANTGTNHLAVGDGAGALLQTSNSNVIIGKYSGNSGGMDIRYTGVYGTPATLLITLTDGTTGGSNSTLTITFGTVATVFFPVSVVTASIAPNANRATVLTALSTALSANVIIAGIWTVTTLANVGVLLTQITPAVVGFPLTAFASTWSVAPTSGLVVFRAFSEAQPYSTNGNLVLSDQLANIRAVCTSNGQWGFGTTQPLAGLHVEGSARIAQAWELANIILTPLTGTFVYDIKQGAVAFFPVAATGNWTFALVYGGDSINAVLPVNHSLTLTFITTQGTTAYYHNTAPMIDGVAVTPTWLGTAVPSEGNASGFDIYTFTIIKTAPAVYTVLASLTQYGGR